MDRVPNWVKMAVAVLVGIWLLILVTDTKILISETKVEPGEDYLTEDWGNLGDASQAQLACKYFNGRKVVLRVLWYDPSNFMGRDSCSFMYRN